MKRQANPTIIGGFVVVAFVLLVSSLIVIGGGEVFKETKAYVLYFEDSVSGLDVGAPVTFQGVNIGFVSEMNVVVASDQDDLTVPVYIEIDTALLKEVAHTVTDKSFIERLIERGLRAQLHMGSLLTGKLEVEFDFHTDAEAYYGKYKNGLQQIPTVSSGVNLLSDVVKEAQATMKSIRKIVESEEVKEAFTSVDVALDDTSQLVKRIDGQLDPTLVPLQEGAHEFREAMRAFRELAEYLTRHPEALLKGKSDNGGDR